MPRSPLLLASSVTILLIAVAPVPAQMARTPDSPTKSSNLDKAVPGSKAEVQLSFAPVVKRGTSGD